MRISSFLLLVISLLFVAQASALELLRELKDLRTDSSIVLEWDELPQEADPGRKYSILIMTNMVDDEPQYTVLRTGLTDNQVTINNLSKMRIYQFKVRYDGLLDQSALDGKSTVHQVLFHIPRPDPPSNVQEILRLRTNTSLTL